MESKKTEQKALNVLLADDDKDDRFFFKKALNELTISTQLKTVHDGEELIDYLIKHKDNLPDVLFLDLNMPRKNGFESLIEIKHNEDLKDIYVVMFSTSFPRDMNYEREMINILFSAGAQDYVRKSDDFEQHKNIINHVLNMVIEKKSLNESENIN